MTRPRPNTPTAPPTVVYTGAADLLILGPDDGLSAVIKFPRGVPVEVTAGDHALLLASSRAHQLQTTPDPEEGR